MKDYVVQLTTKQGKSVVVSMEELFAEMLKADKKEKTLSQMNHAELTEYAKLKEYDVNLELIKAQLYKAIKKIEK